MDDNLVGYLLNSLDEESQREVEAYLAADARAGAKLEKLQQALAPLAADRQGPAPPADLVFKTLAFVAEHTSQELPRAPVPPPAGGAERPFWRRVDFVVAASLLLTVLGFGIPALLQVRDRSASLTACKNNLREFYRGLVSYHDQNRHFPDVDAQAPHNVAGMVVPMLIQAGVLSPEISVRCPGNGSGRPCPLTFEQIKAMGPEEFRKQAPYLASCYAYSLGYRDDQGYHPPALGIGMPASFPLMSDRPPRDGGTGNSSNHNGSGQNVLFQDGHVKFLPGRAVDFDADIFRNQAGKIGAGLHPRDVVLGSSGTSP